MARKGITYDLVANAAAAIKARGVEPTISSVRIELNNEGSFSTISQHLAKWRSEAAEKVDVRSLPESVENAALQAITVIWNIATTEARDEIAAIKEEHNGQKKLLQQDLSALLQGNKALEEALDREANQVKTLETKLAEAEKKLASMTGELEAMDRSYKTLLSTIKQPAAPERQGDGTKPARPAKKAAAPESTPAEPQQPSH